MKLTEVQKEVIIGSLLGDGCLGTETSGNTWRYRALQATAQRPYLEYKYNCLQNLCDSGILYGSVYDKRTGKWYERDYFNTRVLSCFKHYGNMFYTFNPKTGEFLKDVPKNIEQLLSPHALAILYQDDGALKWRGHSNAMRICTESFSEEGLNRLKKAIKNKYDIKTMLTPKYVTDKQTKIKELKGYRVYIPEESSAAFVNLIKPYLTDCMKYKVSNGKRGDLSQSL